MAQVEKSPASIHREEQIKAIAHNIYMGRAKETGSIISSLNAEKDDFYKGAKEWTERRKKEFGKFLNPISQENDPIILEQQRRVWGNGNIATSKDPSDEAFNFPYAEGDSKSMTTGGVRKVTVINEDHQQLVKDAQFEVFNGHLRNASILKASQNETHEEESGGEKPNKPKTGQIRKEPFLQRSAHEVTGKKAKEQTENHKNGHENQTDKPEDPKIKALEEKMGELKSTIDRQREDYEKRLQFMMEQFQQERTKSQKTITRLQELTSQLEKKLNDAMANNSGDQIKPVIITPPPQAARVAPMLPPAKPIQTPEPVRSYATPVDLKPRPAQENSAEKPFYLVIDEKEKVIGGKEKDWKPTGDGIWTYTFNDRDNKKSGEIRIPEGTFAEISLKRKDQKKIRTFETVGKDGLQTDSEWLISLTLYVDEDAWRTKIANNSLIKATYKDNKGNWTELNPENPSYEGKWYPFGIFPEDLVPPQKPPIPAPGNGKVTESKEAEINRLEKENANLRKQLGKKEKDKERKSRREKITNGMKKNWAKIAGVAVLGGASIAALTMSAIALAAKSSVAIPTHYVIDKFIFK